MKAVGGLRVSSLFSGIQKTLTQIPSETSLATPKYRSNVRGKNMIKGILKILSKIIGVGFMLLAFFQWITFDYPDVNPIWPGAIFAPGMFSQIFNWIFVCILGVIGWGFFTLGKFKLMESTDEPPKL